MRWVAALIGVACIGGAGFIWLREATEALGTTPRGPGAATAAHAVAPTGPAQPAASYPLKRTEGAGSLPILDRSDRLVRGALSDLVGRAAVLAFLDPRGFVRHAVATVDNLGREHAPVRLWPVLPVHGRMPVVETDNGLRVAHANDLRYLPFVRLATSVDAARAAALYRHLYPLFQQAFEDLGYPGKYFNDRLVAVIDVLLATPEVNHPIRLTLARIRGPIRSTRP